MITRPRKIAQADRLFSSIRGPVHETVHSSERSENIEKYFLDEGKSRLKGDALDREIKNKQFIEEQIKKTVDALARDRLYSLYGQEVEREMMVQNLSLIHI